MSYTFEDTGDHTRFFKVYSVSLRFVSLRLSDFEIMFGLEFKFIAGIIDELYFWGYRWSRKIFLCLLYEFGVTKSHIEGLWNHVRIGIQIHCGYHRWPILLSIHVITQDFLRHTLQISGLYLSYSGTLKSCSDLNYMSTPDGPRRK